MPAKEVQARLLSAYSLDILPPISLPRVRVRGRWAKISKGTRHIKAAAGWILKVIGGAIAGLGFLIWGLFDGCGVVDRSGHQINTGPLIVRGIVLVVIGLAIFGVGRVLHGQRFMPDTDGS
jgi:hypothetical protein